MRIKCDGCGKTFSGRTEYDAEVKFGAHTCKMDKVLNDLPLDLLRRVAFGEMTTEEATKAVAARVAE